MKLAPLLRKIFMIDILKGMSITFRHQRQSDVITEQYPLERPEIADRFRGHPRLDIDPATGLLKCTGCGVCALACPEKCIVVETERDPQTNKKKMKEFYYDLSRCMFCGLCQEACNFSAIHLTKDYEIAYYQREGMKLNKDNLEKGPDPKVYKR